MIMACLSNTRMLTSTLSNLIKLFPTSKIFLNAIHPQIRNDPTTKRFKPTNLTA